MTRQSARALAPERTVEYKIISREPLGHGFERVTIEEAPERTVADKETHHGK